MAEFEYFKWVGEGGGGGAIITQLYSAVYIFKLNECLYPLDLNLFRVKTRQNMLIFTAWQGFPY